MTAGGAVPDRGPATVPERLLFRVEAEAANAPRAENRGRSWPLFEYAAGVLLEPALELAGGHYPKLAVAHQAKLRLHIPFE